jgi:hypothetical protein
VVATWLTTVELFARERTASAQWLFSLSTLAGYWTRRENSPLGQIVPRHVVDDRRPAGQVDDEAPVVMLGAARFEGEIPEDLGGNAIPEKLIGTQAPRQHEPFERTHLEQRTAFVILRAIALVRERAVIEAMGVDHDHDLGGTVILEEGLHGFHRVRQSRERTALRVRDVVPPDPIAGGRGLVAPRAGDADLVAAQGDVKPKELGSGSAAGHAVRT